MTYTPIQAANLLGMTREGLLTAIKEKRLSASKVEKRWKITQLELDEFLKRKHDHALTPRGKILFDKEKCYYSALQASKLIQCDRQYVYYALRKNKVPSHKKGGTWVVHIDDLEKFKQAMSSIKRKKHNKAS
jgi:excisionase family DNA binding protein